MFNTERIEQLKKLETPFYYYDTKLLSETLNQVSVKAQKHEFIVHYAVKANTNTHLMRQISKSGLGADCVSGNEVLKALEVGFKPEKIVFAGVGKSDKEIITALENDIFCFNIESVQEIRVIHQLAKNINKKAQIALRLNPNVKAQTHKYITTGLAENKFGINLGELDTVLEILKGCNSLELTGIHFHIGSQILDLDNFKNLCLRFNDIQKRFDARDIPLKHINVGGGLGIDYRHPEQNAIPDFESYFDTFAKNIERRPNQKIHFELGRSIIGQCGNLMTKVLYVKKGNQKQFVIVDAGMNDLIRPALYEAYHKIENLTSTSADMETYDIVGPVCESSDRFAEDFALPTTQRGDLLAIRSTGAYGESMASNYNLRDKAKSYYDTSL